VSAHKSFEITDVEALSALIDALADERKSVRKQAAIAQGKIGPAAKTAVPALIALRDASQKGWDTNRVVFHVKKALEKIDDK
jgi:HEAT repeat protein